LNAQIVSVERVDGIAVLTVSNPPVNTIDAGVRAAVSDAVAQLEGARDVRAVVLLCSGSTFFSGADIGEFNGPPKEEEYRALFNRIEALPVPVVVAMHGTVMGGGLEIALAGHYRVAVASARFGLPEVTLGIIPGAGGTQRMPRLIGVEKTLDLVLSARPVDAKTGVELGFLDSVVEPAPDLRAAALAYARDLLARGAGPRRTGERAVDPASVSAEILEKARTQARKQYPHRQAGLTAVEAIAASARLPLAQGLELETKLVNEAKATVESKGAVHVFFAERATRKVARCGRAA
jgi:3-hydroxyacyl-CoA dehydrogenase